MKKLHSSVALSALAAFLATTAYAADFDGAVSPANWTGFHAGVGGGANFAFAEEEAEAVADSIAPIYFASGESFSDLDEVGALGTIEAGGDYQVNNFVFGALANFDFGSTKMTSHANALIDDGVISVGNFDTTVEVGSSWAIGGRLGMLATDRTLLYVLGGFTQAKISQSAELASSDESISVDSTKEKWKSGYFVGGGVETLVTDSISLRGEYRFADYGKARNEHEVSNINFSSSVSQSSDVTVHSVRAVLSFRF